MSTDWNLIELGDLGVLRFRGADAVKFLQGQVSNDVERLSAERSQLAGYHNPQGRAIALLTGATGAGRRPGDFAA